jgi:hypothetical protein
MRVGVNKGPVLIPTRLASHKPATNTQVISATSGASATCPFDHLTKKSHKPASSDTDNSLGEIIRNTSTCCCLLTGPLIARYAS